MLNSSQTENITNIVIGTRHRKDLGDLESLKQSIKEYGLFHPIVITPNKELVCGRRRLEAYKQLGWDNIPITVISIDDIVYAERDENVCRMDFCPSDAVEIAKAIEEVEKVKAKERQGTRTDLQPSVKFTESKETPSKKQSKEKAAKAVGMSRPTLAKAQEVVAAAEESPEKYMDIKEKMDSTGKVDSAAKELKRRKKEEARIEMAQSAPIDLDVILGNFITTGNIVEDNSVDMVFTDPPYHDLEAYRNLGVFSFRVLKPGGLCLTYLGHEHLPKVIEMMATSLEYVWICANFQTGGKPRIWKNNISVGWKPVLLYCKPPFEQWWTAFVDTIRGKEEKEGHDWQQSQIEAEHYIKGLCPNGGLVVDPFCGSGTTLCAAKNLGMKYLGFEIDPEKAAYARKRLSEID